MAGNRELREVLQGGAAQPKCVPRGINSKLGKREEASLGCWGCPRSSGEEAGS